MATITKIIYQLLHDGKLVNEYPTYKSAIINRKKLANNPEYDARLMVIKVAKIGIKGTEYWSR